MSELLKIERLLVLIPALPLLSAVITAILGPKILRGKSHLPTIIALIASCVASLFLLSAVRTESDSAPKTSIGWEHTVDIWRWASIDAAGPETVGERGNFIINVTLRADTLTAIMLSMVTFVASLVAIYASGYMHGDRGYWRFFSYVSLFVFSMTMLVSVSNFVLLYVFWEAVGACSYLLIGFWYQKPEAAAAGKKAFLVNRIGDFGFALALFLIWTTYGTLNFHDTTANGTTVAAAAARDEALPAVEVAGVLGQTRLATNDYAGAKAEPGSHEAKLALAICLLLMLGACGKSAQFPLHVWLPDAMEGPTPVSALIHAATMVTAGVYMVTRCTPLFNVSPDAQLVVASIGAFTALMAGIIAFTQNDLKRVLAYSTVSQLGYMFLAVGTGSLAGITAGMFHLFTHAFFKALLFLGAGSVMHAMGGIIDMRRFGGLRKLMPMTCWTFLFGCLALSGVFPFAGFFSKDAILAAAYEKGLVSQPYLILFYAGMFTAFLTAMYTFRGFFLTFFGEEVVPEEAGHHAHESPPPMVGPLFILAVGALFIGLLDHRFYELLTHTPSLAIFPEQAEALVAAGDHNHESHHIHQMVALASSILGIVGIGLAAFFYLGDSRPIENLSRVWFIRPIYELSYGKFFFDQIYYALVIVPATALANLAYAIDRNVIDGLVDFCGMIPRLLGRILRSLQTGLVQFYAMVMILGLLVLLGSMYWVR